MIGMLRQESEQVKLLGGKVLFFPVDIDPPGCFVDLQAADLNDLIFRHPAPDQALIPGQMGLHPGHQLAGAEGLCDIIVSAQAQAADLVDVVLLG